MYNFNICLSTSFTFPATYWSPHAHLLGTLHFRAIFASFYRFREHFLPLVPFQYLPKPHLYDHLLIIRHPLIGSCGALGPLRLTLFSYTMIKIFWQNHTSEFRTHKCVEGDTRPPTEFQ